MFGLLDIDSMLWFNPETVCCDSDKFIGVEIADPKCQAEFIKIQRFVLNNPKILFVSELDLLNLDNMVKARRLNEKLASKDIQGKLELEYLQRLVSNGFTFAIRKIDIPADFELRNPSISEDDVTSDSHPRRSRRSLRAALRRDGGLSKGPFLPLHKKDALMLRLMGKQVYNLDNLPE